MSVDLRSCGICSKEIEHDSPITLCPGCGTLYHDDCYRTGADCTSGSCPARTEPATPASGGTTEASETLERRFVSLERTALPNRVKSGEFTPEGMSLETASGRATIAWHSIQLITLGIIEEAVGDQQASKSGLRSMVRKLFFGESDNDQQRVRKVRDVYLLDLFVSDQVQPYRIDGATVNYRSFLGEVSYSSNRNFQRLVNKIVYRSSDSRLDSSTVAFLTGHREKIKHYGGIYDFELESAQNRDRLQSLTTRAEMPLNPDVPPVPTGEETEEDTHA